MNYKKYYRNNMGLHELELRSIKTIIEEIGVKTIVEFGSGASTQFLIDLYEEDELDYTIYSFDHDPQYAYSNEHPALSLTMTPLVKCSNEHFERMFTDDAYDSSGFENCSDEDQRNFRVQNAFYDLDPEDLPDDIELVILDGPNGNGSSISFLHLKEKLADLSYILIDDANHHDYVQRCKDVLGGTIIDAQDRPEIHPLFSYCVIKVEK